VGGPVEVSVFVETSGAVDVSGAIDASGAVDVSGAVEESPTIEVFARIGMVTTSPQPNHDAVASIGAARVGASRLRLIAPRRHRESRVHPGA
jgi:hypothetical protein